MELVDRVGGQVEHRVSEPRVRAGIALLGDHGGLGGGVEPADRVDESPDDVFVLAQGGGRPAEDPVERLILRLADPVGPRRIEIPRRWPRRHEERAVHENDEHDNGGGEGHARPGMGKRLSGVRERRHHHAREKDHQRREERQDVARLAEMHERADDHRRERPPEQEPLP